MHFGPSADAHALASSVRGTGRGDWALPIQQQPATLESNLVLHRWLAPAQERYNRGSQAIQATPSGHLQQKAHQRAIRWSHVNTADLAAIHYMLSAQEQTSFVEPRICLVQQCTASKMDVITYNTTS